MKSVSKIILLAFFILTKMCYSQNAIEEVVYLKNGSIIKGIIIEQIPNQSIKIQTKDNNVFVFKFDEIEKITKEVNQTKKANTTFDKSEIKNVGFTNITELNFNIGIGETTIDKNTIANSNNSYGIRTINGYQVNNKLFMGFGLGIEKFSNNSYLPFTIDARISFLKRSLRPVFIASAGYAVGINNTRSTFVINPQIGLKKYITKNIAYFLSFGYRLQPEEISYIKDNFYTSVSGGVGSVHHNYSTVTAIVNMNYISISTGLSF